MSESFYGGRAGFSFIIVMNYTSIDEMVSCFQQGPDYTAVHFDEHVLIDTENKNDPDNGKIFRRGYDYNNDLGGAIYVGTIVGPAGKAPMLELTTVEEVKEKQAEEGYDYRYGEGSYAPFDNLIPGKDGDTYNDAIQWAYCSIRDENESDCIAYIGFIFPYLVVDYTAESVSPYYNRSDSTANFVNTDLSSRTDDGSHPYYEQWHFNIPKGIKGESLNNFRVITADSSIENYTGQSDDISNKREVLVYDYYNYDKDESGEPVTIYLGDYNMITGVTLDEDGTITITYTHDNDTVYTNKLKWIEEVTLDTSNGHFTIIYNYDTESDGTTTKYETDLDWVSSITMADDGTVTIHHITGTFETLSEKIKWVDDVVLSTDGTLTIDFNDGSSTIFNKEIKWITDVSLSDNGKFTISFNNEDSSYTTNIVWVKNLTVNDDGTISVVYNDGTSTTYSKLVKWISDVAIEIADSSGTEGTGDQKVHVTYNTGETDIIGEPLNYIMKMKMVDSDYHLLVWYSDPAKRAEIIAAGDNYTYDGEDGWYDLGSVKDESGILIGLNISLEDGDTAIDYLNNLYPNGLTGTNLQGKIVTIGDLSSDKKFYAYDYNNNTWYYLGSISTETDNLFIVAHETDNDLSKKQTSLFTGGLWFVLEDI